MKSCTFLFQRPSVSFRSVMAKEQKKVFSCAVGFFCSFQGRDDFDQFKHTAGIVLTDSREAMQSIVLD